MKTKRCIACKEEIHVEALKCPHCMQVQSKAANLQNKPAFMNLVMGILVFLILWFLYFVVTLFFTDSIEPQFDITSSELLVTASEEHLNVRCVADIKNTTAQRWGNFSLQATFHNVDGDVIDVLYAKPRVTVFPLFSFKGMVSGEGSTLMDDYQSCQIKVINAD